MSSARKLPSGTSHGGVGERIVNTHPLLRPQRLQPAKPLVEGFDFGVIHFVIWRKELGVERATCWTPLPYLFNNPFRLRIGILLHPLPMLLMPALLNYFRRLLDVIRRFVGVSPCQILFADPSGQIGFGFGCRLYGGGWCITTTHPLRTANLRTCERRQPLVAFVSFVGFGRLRTCELRTRELIAEATPSRRTVRSSQSSQVRTVSEWMDYQPPP